MSKIVEKIQAIKWNKSLKKKIFMIMNTSIIFDTNNTNNTSVNSNEYEILVYKILSIKFYIQKIWFT